MGSWRWTIGRKIASLSVTGLLVSTVIGLVSFVSVDQVRSLTDTRARLITADQELRQLDLKQSDLQIAERDSLLAVTDPDRRAALAEFTTHEQAVTQAWTALSALSLPSDVRTVLRPLQDSYSAYVSQVRTQMDVLANITPGSTSAVAAMVTERHRAEVIQKEITAARTQITEQVARTGSELSATIVRVQTVVISAMLAGMVLLGLISIRVTRMITRPVAGMAAALDRLAGKDLTASVDIRSRDEIADMGHSFNTAVAAVRDAVGTLNESASTLAAASEELGAVSTQLGHAAEDTASQTGLVAASANEVAGSVGTMSAATEEMTASISEIAGQATRASAVATEAVRTADETSAAVTELDRASAEIGEIVKVITSIAEQTNLLALNATIEAARAGDAGKGFAVVASEVKELAQETSRATDDITSKISGIQGTTARATDAIARIASVISQISENQTTIAAAVEEQTATTSEISRSVGEIAAGSQQIANTIGNISQSADHTSQGAGATQQAAHELSELAQRVRSLVGQFTY